ncbi:tetratricopeptide repeat protein [Streptomyces sp. NPDC048172]|uniref:tetratricopeptide repeat protein n=1 Tax=Streptomyces sp. NPDC048172 TaxID=3365505 RepID=UPI0037236AD3
MSVNNFFGVRVLDLDRERCRVCFRILVTNYEDVDTGDEDDEGLLPDDPSFFFRVLCEAADTVIGYRYGPLTDVVTFGEYFDDDWVDRNTYRFVARVERVAVRNLPVDKDTLEWLPTYDGECDGRGWPDEKRLAQGDYEVRVTDARWLEPLRVGDCWDTGNYATTAVAPLVDEVEERYAQQAGHGSMDACFMLGWLRQERGDAAGAAEWYLRAAHGTAPQVRGKALVYLGDLQAGQGEHEAACATYQEAEESEQHKHYASRYRSRAALRRGVLLRRLGREEEAQATFARALARVGVGGDQSLVAEVRRLTSAESSAAMAHRLLGEAGRAGAVALVGEHCGEPVAALAGHLFTEDFCAAEALLATLVDADDRDAATTFLVDLAFVWADERPWREMVAMMLGLAVSTGRAAEGYRRAVRRTGALTTPGVRKAARQLLELLEENGDEAAVIALATAAEPVHPGMACRGFWIMGNRAKARGDFTEAARWFERGAADEGADADTRASATYRLGLCLRELGETARAQEAFAQAEAAYGRLDHTADNAALAARQLAGLAYVRGDRTTAFAAWGRSAVLMAQWECRSKIAVRALHTLGELLTELNAPEAARAVDQAVEREGAAYLRRVRAASKSHLIVACHYGHWMGHAGDRELGRALLRKVAEGQGKWAAAAAVTLGATAQGEGDNATAREWLHRAVKQGDGEMSHKARTNLGIIAKEERNLPELLKHWGPTAESHHEDGPLFAAHLGDLNYLLEDWDEAVHWYRLTLDRSDDPVLVGEAGYRVGEILTGQDKPEAAFSCFRRAVDSGYEPFAQQARELLNRAD